MTNPLKSAARERENVHGLDIVEQKVDDPREADRDNVGRQDGHERKFEELVVRPHSLEVSAAERNGDERDDEL